MSGEAASYFGNVNHEAVTRYAATHSESDNDDDKNMFSSVFSQILGNNHGAAEEDEVKEAASAHERVYSQ
ncbi:hypothetical protein VTP01DRAFT_8207, partial [Rhizomucor pusillus]|uniref:uncharacterized protein n=1 Tax=Rhizomucor pusillus TaxID=4840 RepID=UPI0037440213